MKGYFSKLAQHTGLSFGPGGRTAPSSSPATPAVGARRQDQEEWAPTHIEAVTLTTPSPLPAPAAPKGSNEETTAREQVDAVLPTRIESLGVSASVDTSVDTTVTTDHEVTTSQPEASNAKSERTRELTPVSSGDKYAEFILEETPIRSMDPESKTGERHASSAEEGLSAGGRQMVQFSEGPSLGTEELTPNRKPQIEPDTIFEGPSLRTEELTPDRKVQIKPGTVFEVPALIPFEESQIRAEDRSLGRQQRTVKFSEIEESPSQFASSGYPQSDQADQNQTVRRPEAEAQRLQPVEEDVRDAQEARLDPVRDEQKDQEVAVRNYMKAVRAWVDGTPARDDILEQDSWNEARQEQRDVLAFEYESGGPSFPRYARAEEPGVQDVSLSIGNISVVIEEPQRNVSAPPAAPPPVERSSERTGSEPTNLSRYYLRSW